MFRILSLDGGGIKGAFTASVLATLEEDTGKSVVDHFDLIAGTSTGGILAIGLGLGLSAREICDFYASKGPEIFPSTSLIQRTSGFFANSSVPSIPIPFCEVHLRRFSVNVSSANPAAGY
jgi:uncharacterized protein